MRRPNQHINITKTPKITGVRTLISLLATAVLFSLSSNQSYAVSSKTTNSHIQTDSITTRPSSSITALSLIQNLNEIVSGNLPNPYLNLKASKQFSNNKNGFYSSTNLRLTAGNIEVCNTEIKAHTSPSGAYSVIGSLPAINDSSVPTLKSNWPSLILCYY